MVTGTFVSSTDSQLEQVQTKERVYRRQQANMARIQQLDRSLLHEQGFNYKLAEALAYINSNWRENPAFIKAERPRAISRSDKRADLIIDDPRIPRIVIESSYGGDRDKDADDKLSTGDFHTAISLSIPKEFKHMAESEALDALIQGAKLEYAVKRFDFRFPDTGYIEGTTKDLASMVLAVAVPKQDVERVADEVADYVNCGAQQLAYGLSESDCQEIAKRVHQRTSLTAFRTVMILWMDAMLVQRQLRKQGVEVEVLPISDVRIDNLADAWKRIMALNWHSIYASAIEVLERSAERAYKETTSALNWLLKAVNTIESSRLGEHINVGAELFPKVSVDQKAASAFYTTPSIAEMLVYLTIQEGDRTDWSDPQLFEKDLRVVDMACGTGTLLREAFNRIRSLHDANGGTVQTLGLLHKLGMEHGIRGCDVSPIAAHLTNSSMAVLGDGRPYGTTQIGWVSVGTPIGNSTRKGTKDGQLTTGSLEFLKRESLDDLFDTISQSTLGESLTSAVSATVSILNGSADYVVMNPPYSRTRGGQSAFDIAGLSTGQRYGCQARWASITKSEPCTRTAGLGASFVCMAAKKVKKGGRIGFVLPNTAAFASSWGKTRQMITERFTDIIAISKAGKSEGRDALSADTGLGEMLLVAKRKSDESDVQPSTVKCVSLKYVPVHLGIAGEFAKSILKTVDSLRGDFSFVRIGQEEVGTVENFCARGENPWSPLGVLNPELSAAASGIADRGHLIDVSENDSVMKFRVQMKRMEEVFTVGPTHHLIGHLHGGDPGGAHEFFDVSGEDDSVGGLRALWKADAKSQYSLVVHPTHKGSVHNEQEAQRLSNKKGRLHYQRGIQWTSQRVLAASTKLPVHGGRAWTTLIHEDHRVEKAFSLWANSTLGFFVQWTRGQRSQRGRSSTQVRAIRNMPCPDLASLSERTLDKAASAFHDLSMSELKPAVNIVNDHVRHKLDKAVVVMLGLPVDRAMKTLEVCRRWWSLEPTVSGKNRA